MALCSAPFSKGSFLIHLLPHAPPSPASSPSNASTWPTLLQKSKSLRLHALASTPSAFSSTHAHEAAFDDSVWDARLRNPDAWTFIAVQASKDETMEKAGALGEEDAVLERLVKGEWIGMIVLVRGTPESEFYINALFVVVKARGAGLGTRLLEAVIEHGRAVAGEVGSEKARFVVLVLDRNEGVREWYESIGFEVVKGVEGGVEMEVWR